LLQKILLGFQSIHNLGVLVKLSEAIKNNKNGGIKNQAGDVAPPGLNSRTDEKPALSTESPGSTKPRSGWKIKENAQGIFMAIGAKSELTDFLSAYYLNVLKSHRSSCFFQLPESVK
jgi:hypothetical protein